MDYLTQDNIGIKINSILLTDDCLDFDITFKFNEGINVDSKNFSFGYAVYDENKNIYNIQPRLFSKNKENNKISFIYKELGLNYNAKSATAQQFSDTAIQQITGVSEANRTMDFNLTLRAKDKFPQSKTIYIKIFDLGYTMSDIKNENNELTINNFEDFNLSKAKWNFEIEVPVKFYERNTIKLMPKNEIPGISIENISISETGMSIRLKSEEYDNLIKKGKNMETNEFKDQISDILNITDLEGKTYKIISSRSTQEQYEYNLKVDVGLKDLNKKLYINYNNDGMQYKEELIIK